MSTMIKEAIEKINGEMQKAPNDIMREAVGQYLIDLCKNDKVAGKLLREGKTLDGAIDAMTEHAKKHAKGGRYAMAPEEALKIVGDYFGIGSGDIGKEAESVEEPQKPEPQKSDDISIDFDSFWG